MRPGRHSSGPGLGSGDHRANGHGVASTLPLIGERTVPGITSEKLLV